MTSRMMENRNLQKASSTHSSIQSCGQWEELRSIRGPRGGGDPFKESYVDVDVFATVNTNVGLGILTD